ncbi:MAG: hypothetical protein AAF193_05295, partial [Bacteroidota bacterium]
MKLTPRGQFEKVNSGFDLVSLLKPVLKAWPVYIIMVLAGILSGKYLVDNAKPKFQVDASLKVNRSFEFPTFGNEQNLTGLRIFAKICIIYNYIGRVNNRTVLSAAYKKQQLELDMRNGNQILLDNRPYTVLYNQQEGIPLHLKFELTPLTDSTFVLSSNAGDYSRMTMINGWELPRKHYKAFVYQG